MEREEGERREWMCEEKDPSPAATYGKERERERESLMVAVVRSRASPAD